MIQQQAFTGNGKMLKGGLHCHTTRSDALVSPEEVTRLYYEKGYDFLAITDHRRYNFKNFAPELPITIIPGMEFDNTLVEYKDARRCFHTVCLGPAKEDGNGYEQDDYFKSGTAKNQEEYQKYLDEIHAKGNITMYCHPQWSATPARYFEKLQGDFAMEIWNADCARNEDTDTDAAYWDEILGEGKIIYGAAVDDAHVLKDYCKGWVMVKAENNINAILQALKNGEFYSSCGPEIYNFYVDGNKAVVECSPAQRVRFHCYMHSNKMVHSDGSLTRAEITLEDDIADSFSYLRAVVIDTKGKYAWTNPIFLDGRK